LRSVPSFSRSSSGAIAGPATLRCARTRDRSPTLAPAFTVALVVSLVSMPSLAAQQPRSLDPEAVHETARHDFHLVPVARDLEFPWSMAWLPSGDLLITERPGRLRVVRDGVLDPIPVQGLPTVYREAGQGGVMDVLPHPEFETNRWLYLTYGRPNDDGSQGTTTLVRGRFDGTRLSDVEELFVADAWAGNNNHFSGRMVFDQDGYLYVSIGDRQVDPDLGVRHPAQDLSNHLGKIVRLNDDGSVPADNPFIGHPGAKPEIWTYGNRNPQGFAVDPRTGALWITDHGPRGGDELNQVVRGGNYGWPVVSYGVHYNGEVFTTETTRPGMESPRWTWIPSIGTSGLTFYEGDAFPWWRGNAFAGGLVGEQLGRITLEGGSDAVSEETLLSGVLGRIRDVRTGPDGLLYLAIEGLGRGALTDVVRMEPVAGEVRPPPSSATKQGTSPTIQ